ncbi:hypothetical protein Zmor_006694 [Zophobas morio]|uniref:Uncharacterized protein n=1 Tax=Zophobas morio TaxID=2755281 RepID=A0AA38IS96_9CUCU|nr:hypothetical protein Zmor_006694 [Zophobas morio]
MACKELTEAELHELVEELMQNSDSEGVYDYDSGEGESEEDEVDNNTITSDERDSPLAVGTFDLGGACALQFKKTGP